jgi:anti-sigma factor RsiW
MCEFSSKLVAWLDGELPDREAVGIERHLRACLECQERLDRYKNVSEMVRAYCDATLDKRKLNGALPSWVPVLGAAASLALLLAIFAYQSVQRLPAHPSTLAVATAPKVVAAVAPSAKVLIPANRKPLKRALPVSSRSRVESRETRLPAEPAIEIAIPANAVFPPGALPPGFGFVAEVRIASDGSAQELSLHPELTGFQGGPNQ